MVLVATSLVGAIMPGFCCCAALKQNIKHIRTGAKKQLIERNFYVDNSRYNICICLTEPACILELYLEHFHGGGDNDLTHPCTTTCQHLFEHCQPLSVDRQEKYLSNMAG